SSRKKGSHAPTSSTSRSASKRITVVNRARSAPSADARPIAAMVMSSGSTKKKIGTSAGAIRVGHMAKPLRALSPPAKGADNTSTSRNAACITRNGPIFLKNPGMSHLRARASGAPYSTPGQDRIARVRLALAAAIMILVHGAGANDAVPVSVEPLSALSVTLSGSAPGTAVSLHRTEVASRLAGVIDSIAVEVGDRVAAGDVLAALDCTEYVRELARHEAQIEALEARRTLADAQLERALKLLPTRNIPEEQVNQRRAEFDVASAEIVAQEAQVAISRRQVEHCRVVRPFDGVVTRRTASLGAYVAPGTAVAEIIDTDRVEVTSQVPLGDVGLLATRPLSFRTDNGEHEVALRTLVPLIDASSRSQEARLRFTGE